MMGKKTTKKSQQATPQAEPTHVQQPQLTYLDQMKAARAAAKEAEIQKRLEELKAASRDARAHQNEIKDKLAAEIGCDTGAEFKRNYRG